MGNALRSSEKDLLPSESLSAEKPKRSSHRQRTHVVHVRVTTAERKELERISTLVAKPVSTYVRTIALGSEIKSKTDERLVLEVARLRGDLGRVGGLLKLWLTNEERFDFESGKNPSSSDVRRVLAQVEHLIGSIEKVVSEL